MTQPTTQLMAVIETGRGTIRARLFWDKTPLTVASFVNLARRGFYDGLTFHRVEPEFVIQGGCPRGDGTGDPGYAFEDEIVKDLRHDKAGILSMANAGPGTNGSQFFVTHVPTPWLDGKHTVFGKTVGQKDLDVVNSIAAGDKIVRITIEGDAAPLFAKTGARLDGWNRTLDQKFPHLAPAEG